MFNVNRSYICKLLWSLVKDTVPVSSKSLLLLNLRCGTHNMTQLFRGCIARFIQCSCSCVGYGFSSLSLRFWTTVCLSAIFQCRLHLSTGSCNSERRNRKSFVAVKQTWWMVYLDMSSSLVPFMQRHMLLLWWSVGGGGGSLFPTVCWKE